MSQHSSDQEVQEDEDSGYTALDEAKEAAASTMRSIFDSEEDAVEEAIQAKPSSNLSREPGIYFCRTLRYSPTFYNRESPRTPENTPSQSSKACLIPHPHHLAFKPTAPPAKAGFLTPIHPSALSIYTHAILRQNHAGDRFMKKISILVISLILLNNPALAAHQQK